MVKMRNETELKNSIWVMLENVSDPEIPVLSVVDLGVVRDVLLRGYGTVEIVITPTYTGCPAM
jgi:ring-1,2-phenylacetyl-CoA epoxidase subunit PaaD